MLNVEIAHPKPGLEDYVRGSKESRVRGSQEFRVWESRGLAWGFGG